MITVAAFLASHDLASGPSTKGATARAGRIFFGATAATVALPSGTAITGEEGAAVLSWRDYRGTDVLDVVVGGETVETLTRPFEIVEWLRAAAEQGMALST